MMYKLIKPLLFLLDPEYAHDKTVNLARRLAKHPRILNFIDKRYSYEAPELETEVLGMKFKNPVGNAAGFDKDGNMVDFLPCLNFGYTVVGSVCSYKFNGRRKPRIFRLKKDKAILNRSGLNGAGADEIYQKLQGKKFSTPLGISIAKTNRNCIVDQKALFDYLYTYELLYDIGDFFELNFYCPSAKNGKYENSFLEEVLRCMNNYRFGMHKPKKITINIAQSIPEKNLAQVLTICDPYFVDKQNIWTIKHPFYKENTTITLDVLPSIPVDKLENVLELCKEYSMESPMSEHDFEQPKPLFVKLPPDFSDEELNAILEVCENNYVDGYVVCNTTKNKTGLATAEKKLNEIGDGGISGLPLAKRAEELTKQVYAKTKGKKAIVGVGGINVENAYDRILAGASLLQVYTSLVYEGPGLVKQINTELVRRMQADGVKNVKEIVGKGAKSF